ncbi:methylcrotonoyl-CoA carboxylase subunit alpha, mitochondrial isoform X1 [Iris pallida]|uniref:Methylcrotonoyl-CoA carboxylase subunit alpha, mitochondrial isoform X1 n=1 Tax=Iris pallida TaxID=29817 RepID=A0AAX6GNU9_IRIPA|nr:methylcrotonoyl-CoA carboxylase subunit alpha, mitochondrial isoform X1 [Iris pallida]
MSLVVGCHACSSQNKLIKYCYFNPWLHAYTRGGRVILGLSLQNFLYYKFSSASPLHVFALYWDVDCDVSEAS